MEDFLAPKYYLLKKEIVHQIDNEFFKDGELIPSERELVQKYGVSRITVRRAIDELVSEGYLYRVQGKGTFVKSNLLEQNIITLNSITQDIIAMNKKPRRIVNRVEIAPSFPKRTKELEINPNDKLIIIDRLYLGDDEPVTRTISYIPYKYFPGLEKYDFVKNSLFEVLEKDYGVKITRGLRTIEAINPPEGVAEMLQIKKQPVILFRGTTYALVNGKEVPIESFKSYYRSDNRRFSISQVKIG